MASKFTNMSFYTTAKLLSTGTSVTISNDIERDAAVTLTADANVLFQSLDGGTIERMKVTATGGTLTVVARGLDQTSSPSEVTALKQERKSGTLVKVIQAAWDIVDKDGDNTLSGANTFSGVSTFTGAAARVDMSGALLGMSIPNLTTAQRTGLTAESGDMVYDTDLLENYQYIGGAWSAVSAGSTQAAASTTVAGKVEEATVAEVGAGTAAGGTGARLFINPTAVVKTSAGAGDENKIPALNASGQFASGFIGASSGAITGEIRLWTTDSAPTSWLICDGAAVNRTTYADLFAVISDTYGVGDGSTTFNLPNLKNRVPIGRDTSVKVVIDNCDGAWTAGANVVATNDTGDKKEGTGSVKLAVAAGAGATQILGYKAISSFSLAGKTIVGMWIKSSITLSAGDLKYQLDDTAALASPLESINIPALVAGQWTKIYLTLSVAANDTAIISHGIYQQNDVGAFDLWIDDVNFGENYELGAAGGEATHTLRRIEITTSSRQSTNGDNAGGGGMGAANDTSTAHNNLQPYIALNYIIKT